MPGKSAGAQRLSARGLQLGIVVSRFNRSVTARLLAGARRTLRRQGAAARAVEVVWVPGAFEIPAACRRLARSGRFDALIALGAVVRGGTPHFEYVAYAATRGILEVTLREGIPVAFGLLTTNNMRQAMERAGGRHGNKGDEAALVAIEMARLLNTQKGRRK